MSPRTEKTIDILLDALNEGTLAAGTCSACACGNIVAAHMGIRPEVPTDAFDYIEKFRQYPNTKWIAAVTDTNWATTQDKAAGLRMIEETGFTVEEFKSIEKAFERASLVRFSSYEHYTPAAIRKDQIKALSAVVKVLLDFDQADDDVKEIFTKRAEAIPLPC